MKKTVLLLFSLFFLATAMGGADSLFVEEWADSIEALKDRIGDLFERIVADTLVDSDPEPVEVARNTAATQEWTACDFKKWAAVSDDTTFKAQFGGPIMHYPEIAEQETTWMEIDNNWINSGDTLAYNNTDILKTSVNLTGKTTIEMVWNDTVYILTQKLRKLIWLRTSDWAWIDVVPSVNWSNVSLNGRFIAWQNVFPGVNYEVEKWNGMVFHRIKFKPTFLDSAVTLYNQRADSLEIALANVMEYSLSATIDNYDVELGSVNKRKLKQFGKWVFNLSSQSIYFPGSDTLPRLAVKQFWVKRGGKLYNVEYVMMSRLKQIHEVYPDSVIWHNDTKEFKQDDLEDSYINSNIVSKNYGGQEYMLVEEYSRKMRMFSRPLDVAGALGEDATISAVACSLYCDWGLSGTNNVSIYRVLKPWVEDSQMVAGTEPPNFGVSWNDWATDSCLLRPNGDNGTNDWTPQPGGTHYTTVDEDNIDLSDADYVAETTLNEMDEWDLEDITVPATTIDSVRLTYRVKGSDDFPDLDRVTVGIKLSGSYTWGTERGSVNFTTYTEKLDKPGGGSWTNADINNLIISVKMTQDDDIDGVWCSWAYVMVFTSGTGVGAWTTAGAGCVDGSCPPDDGDDNTCDGEGCDASCRDRACVAEDVVNVNQTGVYFGWDIGADLGQGWYDGTMEEEGVIFVGSSTKDKRFYSSEKLPCIACYAKWIFSYTTGAPEAAPLMRRRKLLENLLQGEVENEKNPFILGSYGFAGWAELGLRDCQ